MGPRSLKVNDRSRNQIQGWLMPKSLLVTFPLNFEIFSSRACWSNIVLWAGAPMTRATLTLVVMKLTQGLSPAQGMEDVYL